MKLETPLSRKLGLKYPLVAAPMFLISNKEMLVAGAEAGILPCMPSLNARTPEGRTGHRPARFIGADGPRWFLRGVITGKAAVEPAAAERLEQVFAQTVVVRGTEARPPRDLLALRLPGAAPVIGTVAPDERPEPDFDPLTRGPEITEIR